MSTAVSSTPPHTTSPALSLPPCGTEGAADAEMGGLGGCAAELPGAAADTSVSSCASSSTSGPVTGSAWTSAASSGSSPAQQEAAPAEPDKRRQKAKEKKRRQKEKKKVAARQRSDEAKAEVVDDDVNEPQLSAAATLVDTWTTRHGSTWESYGQLCDALEVLVQDGMYGGWDDDELVVDERGRAWYDEEETAGKEWA